MGWRNVALGQPRSAPGQLVKCCWALLNPSSRTKCLCDGQFLHTRNVRAVSYEAYDYEVWMRKWYCVGVGWAVGNEHFCWSMMSCFCIVRVKCSHNVFKQRVQRRIKHSFYCLFWIKESEADVTAWELKKIKKLNLRHTLVVDQRWHWQRAVSTEGQDQKGTCLLPCWSPCRPISFQKDRPNGPLRSSRVNQKLGKLLANSIEILSDPLAVWLGGLVWRVMVTKDV